MDELKNEVHHLISILTGARKPDCCPKCESEQWFKATEIQKGYKEYNDGYQIYLGADYICTTWYCEDCGYDCD